MKKGGREGEEEDDEGKGEGSLMYALRECVEVKECRNGQLGFAECRDGEGGSVTEGGLRFGGRGSW